MVDGMKYPNSRLTPRNVKAIRAALKAGGYGISAKLAREYGVNPTTILNIKKRRTWREVK